MNQKSEARANREFFRLMARYAPVIGLVPGSVAGGYIIGYGLDHVFGTNYLRMVFLFVGVISGIVQLIRMLGRDM